MAKLKGKNKKWGRCDTHGQGCSVSQDIQATPVNRKTEKHLSLKREWNESETDIEWLLEINKEKLIINQILQEYLRSDLLVNDVDKFQADESVDFRMKDGYYVGVKVCGYLYKKGKLVVSLFDEDVGYFLAPPHLVYKCEYCY